MCRHAAQREETDNFPPQNTLKLLLSFFLGASIHLEAHENIQYVCHRVSEFACSSNKSEGKT
jgi:hypothetical protein